MGTKLRVQLLRQLRKEVDLGMTDREKVIRGLQQHCYGSMFDRCEECPYYEVADEPFQCRDKLLRDTLALLKEQEVKTGYWIDSAGNDKCSNCGMEYSDLYPDYGNTHFCPNCGTKMEKKGGLNDKCRKGYQGA